MNTRKPLALCILNCYPQASRAAFTKADVGHPENFFKDFLARRAPRAAADVLFAADPGTRLPAGAALRSYDGFIWTGSDLAVYQDDPRVKRQLELAAAIYAAGVPSYGSCWGLQIAAAAAGGEVAKSPKGREWCFARALTRTEAGRRSGLLAGKPERYDAFIMHLDEVTRIPPGAVILAGNAHCRVQALEVRHSKGVFWAAQYHPEYNLHEMARLLTGRGEALTAEGFFKNPDEVSAYAEKLEALHADPDSAALRRELAVGDAIIDPGLREVELTNWIAFLSARS